jgi:hypothetical protein
MQITRKSLLSGVVRTLDLPVTQEQIDRFEKGEGLAEDIFPNLTLDQREFILTGITNEDWDETPLDE